MLSGRRPAADGIRAAPQGLAKRRGILFRYPGPECRPSAASCRKNSIPRIIFVRSRGGSNTGVSAPCMEHAHRADRIPGPSRRCVRHCQPPRARLYFPQASRVLCRKRARKSGATVRRERPGGEMRPRTRCGAWTDEPQGVRLRTAGETSSLWIHGSNVY
jgi:hypothetical protein